jgi:hypothetical protein
LIAPEGTHSRDTRLLTIETGNDAAFLDDMKTNHLVAPAAVYKEIKVKDRYLSSQCQPYTCDFAGMTPHVFGPYDLTESCGFQVSSAKRINVFNSSNIRSNSSVHDPDLGSPNAECNPSGPGRGMGGIPSSTYPNCNPLGNLLIVQNPAVTSRPNDDAKGGCIRFDVSNIPDALIIDDFGLLDIEAGVSANVRKSIFIHQKKRNLPMHFLLVLF